MFSLSSIISERERESEADWRREREERERNGREERERREIEGFF